MWSIGFGIERVAWPALKWPRATGVVVLALVIVAAFGATRLTFDENLRGVFAGETKAFADYVATTEDFVDPENETMVLVEGARLGNPDVFPRLLDFQLNLQLLDGIDSVFSLFALREAPDADGNAALLVDDASAGLTPGLLAKIRAHPLLGSRLITANADAMVFVVTPATPKAPLAEVRALDAAIAGLAAADLAGTGLVVTPTGFPAIRAGIVDILMRDQIVLNLAGAAIGFIMSLIIFRSLIGALMTAVPAVASGLVVIGFLGLLGVPVTVMSNVVPVLVMIVGYADGIHLTHAWRHRRDGGASVAAAAWTAQEEVGAACILTALTTAVSFLSLTISNVAVVRGFGWTGALGMLAGGCLILVIHALMTQLLGRFWKRREGGIPDLFAPLGRPCAAVCRVAVSHARTIAVVVVGAFIVLTASYYALPPEHSIREHLPANNPANAALGRIDANFGGAFPIQIVVPAGKDAPTSPAGLARLGAVHKAVAAVPGIDAPLSLWSLVDWLGGTPDAATAARLEAIVAELPPASRSRFIGTNNATLVTASVKEAPTHVLAGLIDAVEVAAKRAGGDGVTVTGVTVITTREGARTIDNLNVSLTFAIFADLAIMILAFRNWFVGSLAVFSNTLPVLATCALLLVCGYGMQFNTVIALTVAFGVTVDETTHYLNRFIRSAGSRRPLGERLIDTSRHVGPVLVGTTVIILAGLTTTLTSGLPTVRLFGLVTAATLAFALIGDLFVLPSLIAGPARRWFDRRPEYPAAAGRKPA